MKERCRFFPRVIEKYRDGELPSRKVSQVKSHLNSCSTCADYLSSLDRMGGLLKTLLKEEVSEVEWSGLWGRVRSQVKEKPSMGLYDRLKVWLAHLRPLRPAIMIPVATMAFLLAFLFGPQLFSSKAPLFPGVIIESVESKDSTVMIFQVEKTDSTIIWLFEPQNG